jgi:hypothetical protein
MQIKNILPLALATTAVAQRPSNVSICDYYTTALLKENTAANQLTLLTLLVNTAVIGNYTQPNVGVAVPGILNPNGTYNGTAVNLVPYFSGALASTNQGGSVGVSVNFLDGGGAAPLMKNMPAENTSSNQYTLLTHLYQFFGSLLGCSQQGMPGYSAYMGDASMYETHKFMVLDPYQMGYFITQVGLAAASFGVAESDITAVATALTKLFDYRCSPKTTVIPAQGPNFQSICTDPSCPLDANATCVDQAPVPMPVAVNGTSSSSMAVPPMSSSMPPSMPSGGSSPSASMSSTMSSSGSVPAKTSSSAGFQITPNMSALFGLLLVVALAF